MTPARSEFLALKRPVEAVPISGGPTVHVRALTTAELVQFRKRVREIPEGPDRDAKTGALLVALALCEPDSTAWFPEPTNEDLAFLESLGAKQVEPIAEAAARLNVPDKDAAKN